ncbi:MAG: ribosome silencing factor [Bacteroidota bacterium]
MAKGKLQSSAAALAETIAPQQMMLGKSNFTLESLNDLIVDGLQDIKGKNIVCIDLRKVADAPAEFFVIAEGESNVQVRAMADSVYRKVKENMQTTPDRIEGGLQSTWVVMDYFNTVVHIFYRETREFYQLEDLWSDGEFKHYQDL